MRVWSGLLVCLAGLLGAAGVAAAAAAAHGPGGTLLSTAAQFALIHAAAILALALAVGGARTQERPLASILQLGAATLLGAGAALFCGDLAFRALREASLFPMAAPTGGMTMIAGWLATAATGVIHFASRYSR